MNSEQAQELYSEYKDGSLSVAMRVALEQHLQTSVSDEVDFNTFSAIWDTMAQTASDEVAVPHGFRATVLERAIAAKSANSRTFGYRVRTLFSAGGFAGAPQRITGGAVAIAASLLVVVSLVHNSVTNSSVVTGGFGATSPASAFSSSTALGVITKPAGDGSTYYMFRLHLPESIPSAVVNASVVYDVRQVTDPTERARSATPALAQPQDYANNEEIQIPVGGTPPSGNTINLLVQWHPDDQKMSDGAQVVFTPVISQSTAASNPEVAPAGGTVFDALRYVAGSAGCTVILDASVAGVSISVPWPAQTDAASNLEAVCRSAGLHYRLLAPNTYQVSK